MVKIVLVLMARFYKITNKGVHDEKRAKDRSREAEEELEEGPRRKRFMTI